MPTVKLTEAFVKIAAVEPGKNRTTWWDEGLPGFGLRVTHTGARSYVVQYKHGVGRSGTDRRMALKRGLRLDDARREAKAILGRVAKGTDVLQQRREEAQRATGRLRAVCESYLEREGGMTRDADGRAVFSDARKLRSAPERLKTFERLIYPALGSKPIGGIKRSDITKLLDKIEDERGPPAARSPMTADARRGLIEHIVYRHTGTYNGAHWTMPTGGLWEEGEPYMEMFIDREWARRRAPLLQAELEAMTDDELRTAFDRCGHRPEWLVLLGEREREEEAEHQRQSHRSVSQKGGRAKPSTGQPPEVIAALRHMYARNPEISEKQACNNLIDGYRMPDALPTAPMWNRQDQLIAPSQRILFDDRSTR